MERAKDNEVPRRVDRLVEWQSKLAIGAVGTLLFLTVSGLFIWVLPFSKFTQLNVLVHTVAGLGFLVPAVWYCVRHWLMYRSHVLTHFKLLGYLSVFVLLACAISGLVLTYQPLFDVKISYFWRAVHDWTTIALILFVFSHIVLPLVRDARAKLTEAVAPIWGAARGFGWGVAMLTAFLLAGVGLAYYAYEPPKLLKDFAADYELWDPHNPLYGKNRPFAPSLARTKDSKPIDAKLLSGSESCGTSGCHEQIVKEWLPSAHRYAAMDKGFQAIQLTMAKQNGPTSTRYCGGCHDPISLFSGTKNIYTNEAQLTALEGYREGISCLACHSVKETDIKGNAYYMLQAAPRYIGEIEYDQKHSKNWRLLRDFLIRAYPRQHVSSLTKVMFKKPEYCAACHKQFVDEEINKVGWVQLQNQFDNWRMSKWARDRKEPQRTIECRECHMPLVKSTDPAAGDAGDYNRSPRDGMHRSHRFIGGNQLMPALLKLEGADQQIRLTNQWLQGQFPVPEIEQKWHKPGVPAVSIQLIAPATVRRGEKMTLKCLITSNKVGHDFPTGPLDIIQSWIELIVKDTNGTVIYETGTVDDKGFIKPGTFMFKAEPVDQYGNLIDRHNLWEMVGVRSRRSLFPGFSDTAEFNFMCPELFQTRHRPTPTQGEFAFTAPKTGKLLVTAKLRYRKMDQFLLNFLRSVGFFPEFEGQRLTSPITDMHEQEVVIEVVS
jgi:Cytochrome c554 and c-prime